MGTYDEYSSNSMQNRLDAIQRNRKHHLHESINRLKREIDKLDPIKDDRLIEQMNAQINNLLLIMTQYYESHESEFNSGDEGMSGSAHTL